MQNTVRIDVKLDFGIHNVTKLSYNVHDVA